MSKNMFIKTANNLVERRVITEDDDGFSALEIIFCNNFTRILHNWAPGA